MGTWTLFSNHGHVLLFLASDPQARLRDVAEQVGITERAVQKIVRDLQDGGLLSVTKRGRRNRYLLNTRKALRHPLEAHRTVGNLVSLMREGPGKSGRSRPGPPAAGRSAAEPDTASSRRAGEDGVEAAPEADVKPGPPPRPEPVQPVAQPETEAEAQPETNPEAQPETEPAAQPEAKSPGKSKPARGKRKGKPGTPPDEQQGSLF